MKKKNIISLAGVVALLMGLGLNLEYALDDYGLKSNSLNLFVLAQASNSGGDQSYGHQQSTTAHCGKTTTTVTTTTSGNSSSVGGGVSAGMGGASAGVLGTTGSSSGNTTTTTVTTTEEYDAEKLYCEDATNMVEVCVNFNPCR
mgnify:CR=1 FL=1